MTLTSPMPLRVLHAVRLLGYAGSAEIADRAAASRHEAIGILHDAEHRGWVQHTAFADAGGWSLTDAGRTENERQLAHERESADPANEIGAVHRDFLPLNARLLRAVTDWQLKPTGEDRLAANDHRDPPGTAASWTSSRRSAALSPRWPTVSAARSPDSPATTNASGRPSTGPEQATTGGSTGPTSTPATGSGSSSTKTSWPPSASTAAPSSHPPDRPHPPASV
ncbi:hypothetical protein GCM10027059_31670 [Myceligenerans halotolerans]